MQLHKKQMRRLKILLSCFACADIGTSGLQSQCAWQENKLAVLWTIGVFALNFGPVLVGPVLDWLGPKLTAFLGELFRLRCAVLAG